MSVDDRFVRLKHISLNNLFHSIVTDMCARHPAEIDVDYAASKKHSWLRHGKV